MRLQPKPSPGLSLACSALPLPMAPLSPQISVQTWHPALPFSEFSLPACLLSHFFAFLPSTLYLLSFLMGCLNISFLISLVSHITCPHSHLLHPCPLSNG